MFSVCSLITNVVYLCACQVRRLPGLQFLFRWFQHGVGVRVWVGETSQEHPLSLHPTGLLLVLQKPGGLHHRPEEWGRWQRWTPGYCTSTMGICRVNTSIGVLTCSIHSQWLTREVFALFFVYVCFRCQSHDPHHWHWAPLGCLLHQLWTQWGHFLSGVGPIRCAESCF